MDTTNTKKYVPKIRRFNDSKKKENEIISLNEQNDNTIPLLLSDQISNLQKRVELLEQTLKEQNVLIINELAAIKVSVRVLCTNKRSAEKISTIFPINSCAQLQMFETNISSMSEDTLIQCVRKIVGKEGLTKNLGSLLGPSVILDYNYQGFQNKKLFKDFKNINHIFFQAIQSDVVTKDNYIKLMKAAFKRSKNLLYKQKYSQKLTQSLEKS